MLSGYLIGGILFRDLYAGRLWTFNDIWLFWKRRWFRTLPNYYLFFILFSLMTKADGQTLPTNWPNYLWFGQALLNAHPIFFTVVWSLAIEEWFYFLFPLFLVVSLRWINQRERAICGVVLLFLSVPVGLRFFLPATAGWDHGVRMVTFARLDAITYGIALAWIKQRYVPIWNYLVQLWPIAAVLVFLLFGHTWLFNYYRGGFDVNSVVLRVFYLCFMSASISLLLPKIVEIKTTPVWWVTVIRKLSLWSYSIYLSHLFCLWLVVYVFGLLHWRIQPGSLALVLKDIIDWVVTIVVSALIYKFYEKPLMDLRDHPSLNHQSKG